MRIRIPITGSFMNDILVKEFCDLLQSARSPGKLSLEGGFGVGCIRIQALPPSEKKNFNS
jgi:hypothetical protein